MKKIVYTLIFTALTVAQTFAQAPVVVGGTQNGDEHATMEILSQDGKKGFMPPRLTTDQINELSTNLAGVSKGLTVFNTDTDCLQFWKGTKWSDCSTYSNAEVEFICSQSTIKGTYNVDKVAGDNEFMEVKVKVTKGGPLVLYTNTQNGIRFYLSTILDIGEHTIQVPALGTPTAAGELTFDLFDQSANPICAGTANFKATVVENKAAFTINCDQSSFVGTILEGSSASGQTLKLKIAVSKSGNYYIKTNTVHGLWFEGSGSVSLGATEIILDLKGSVDTVPGDGKIAFNFFDKNDISLAQCTVTIYVSAEKAVFTAVCTGSVFSGGIGLGTGASISGGARLFYVGYTFGENDYIKVKINVTRPGFVDIGTKPDPDIVKVGMMYTFAGYIDKVGIQDVYLRPVNSKVPPLTINQGGGGYMYLDTFSFLYNNITKSEICSLNSPNHPFTIDKLVANIALGVYDPLLNSATNQYLKNSISLFNPIVPASGLDIKINIQTEQLGLFSFKGVANGMTLESNQGVYTFDENGQTADFKLYGTPNKGGTVVFPMYNVITGDSAGSITIDMREIFYIN
ncbi:hypothetical protein L0669_19045 [Flavobacterium bizetiae]|uniref:hypothetical protein n=1 Tax=Flavobacterium bizetiae TaxID=2704140 RepID=UPI0021E89B15|nr:hypothetical protein [Flavobacterium bizetiae]UTN03420.1 hypothetical protein L0669_19045 [Flavobacterium bizetiae]